jgi:hypothetical protein
MLTTYSAPRLSPDNELRIQLVSACNSARQGMRLKSYVPAIDSLPRYLGHSIALDQAVKCLVDVHREFQNPNTTSQERINAALYLQAVQSLQSALHDPKEQYASTTLAAITMLGSAEAIGSNMKMMRRFVVHYGGASRMIRLLGPRILEDELGRKLVSGFAGTIVSEASSAAVTGYEWWPDCCYIAMACLGGDCFLTEPRWARLALVFDEPHLPSQTGPMAQTLALMNRMGSLLRQARKIGKQVISEHDLHSLVETVSDVLATMRSQSCTNLWILQPPEAVFCAGPCS